MGEILSGEGLQNAWPYAKLSVKFLHNNYTIKYYST